LSGGGGGTEGARGATRQLIWGRSVEPIPFTKPH
jgi:hypothetical protein